MTLIPLQYNITFNTTRDICYLTCTILSCTRFIVIAHAMRAFNLIESDPRRAGDVFFEITPKTADGRK